MKNRSDKNYQNLLYWISILISIRGSIFYCIFIPVYNQIPASVIFNPLFFIISLGFSGFYAFFKISSLKIQDIKANAIKIILNFQCIFFIFSFIFLLGIINVGLNSILIPGYFAIGLNSLIGFWIGNN